MVRPSVRRSVGRSIGQKNGILRILNDLDSAELGGRRDEEEGGTKKEGGGGRKDEASEKMKKGKVAKGRIIGLAGPCFNLL